MLLFGEKRALGERGLRWLKIHLANLAGFDKGSFDERVNFVHENLENIYESATNPLEVSVWSDMGLATWILIRWDRVSAGG